MKTTNKCQWCSKETDLPWSYYPMSPIMPEWEDEMLAENKDGKKWYEREDEIEAYRVELGVSKDKTYIMPAGDTRDTLIEMYPKVFELCAEHGYNMTGRDHIIAFDTERGV